jgi:antitoxin component of MazEF toxin-antitoxin module
MKLITRIDSKARQVGTSLVTTIPWRVVAEWNLKENDRLVLYLLDSQLLIVPLAYLGVIGEPSLLRQLTQTLDSPLSAVNSPPLIGD